MVLKFRKTIKDGACIKIKVSRNETWKLEITSYYKKGTKITIKQNKTQIEQ